MSLSIMGEETGVKSRRDQDLKTDESISFSL